MKKISIVGLDGSGKSSALEIIVRQHLKQQDVQAEVWNLPKYEPAAWEIDHMPIGRRLAGLVDGAMLLGDRLNSRMLAGFFYFAIIGLCYGPYQQFLIRKHNKPELILAERDPVIDGAVYSTYYLPFAHRLAPSQRVTLITDVLRHRLPQTIIYLNIRPEVSMARILKSVDDKSWNGRKLKPHLHENLATLTELHCAYSQVLDVAAARGARVIEVDSTSSPPEQVASQIYSIILPSIMHLSGSTSGNALPDCGQEASLSHPARVLVLR